MPSWSPPSDIHAARSAVYPWPRKESGVRRLFVVTALERYGDRILRAKIREADGIRGTWIDDAKIVDAEELMALVERTDTRVTSITRSAMAGPDLAIEERPTGRMIVPILVPGVLYGLNSVQTVVV